MTLKTIATGSTGNAFILTDNNGKHLLIEAGLPIPEIKKGLDYDIENLQGAIVSHGHKDHALSVNKLRDMGVKAYTPYFDTEHKRMRTSIGDFVIDSFPVPHNGVENRGFIINADNQKICFLIDLEYCPYDFSKLPINILICECNYIESLVDDDIPNLRHKVLGHMELNTAIGIIQNCKRHLRKAFLTHASKGVTMDKAKAIEQIRQSIPEYIECEFVKDNTEYNISEIPF